MACASVEASLAPVLFAVDVVVVLGAGWLLFRAAQPAGGGVLETLLGWILGGLVVVAGSASVLGVTGGFGPVGFLAAHLAVVCGLAFGRRRQIAADGAALRGFLAGAVGAARLPAWRWAVPALALLLLGGVVLAAMAAPVVFDALTYRLPRIAEWLQAGRVGHLDTDDARLNFMPVGPDLVIAWLIGAGGRGYPLAGAAQTAGAALALAATLFFARRTGLGPAPALGAVVLLLGMGNVAPQLASLHTDLFVAGVFAGSAALWVGALERGRGSLLGGAGLGLAAASKGTLLYLGPAGLLWAGWFLWRHRPGWRVLTATVAGAIASLVVLNGPLWARNYAAYGSPAASEASVVHHYGSSGSVGERLAKTALNLRTSFVQACDPNSQPPWLRAPVERLGRALAARLPRSDPHTFEQLDRVGALESYFSYAVPDAEFAGPGLALLAAFLAAGAAAFLVPGAGAVRVWFLGVAAFFVTQNALFQWHPWGFRYAVLVAPWLALVAAWGLQAAPRLVRVAGWTVLLAGAAWVFADATLHARQSAWRGALLPRYAAQGAWHDWAAGLGPSGSTLRLALLTNSPAAQFHRGPVPRPVRSERLTALPDRPAEELVAPDGSEWLVVPATRFVGREGRVLARTWLLQGDETHRISVAAYRALRPGERPEPVLYSDRAAEAESGFARLLRVRAWEDRVTFELTNPSQQGWRAVVASDAGRVETELPPGTRVDLVAPVAPDGGTRVRLEFVPTLGLEPDGRVPFLGRVR